MRASPLPPNPDPSLNQRITPQLVGLHGLSLEEYEAIQRLLHRDPSLTELAVFGALWSEDCSYKSTRVLLRQFPLAREGDVSRFGRVLVKAGEESAGVVDIGGDWAIAFKLASHNRGSRANPFDSGSAGVGGIIRDVFTMGARPVLLTASLRVGELSSADSRGQFEAAVSGVAHYSTEAGVPLVGGDVYFDGAYEGSPLVNALCLGVLPHSQVHRGRAAGAGNPVFLLGAPTGRGGGAPAGGDPGLGRLLLEACLELMATPGLAVGIQKLSTGGLAGAAARASHRGGAGLELDLDRLHLAEGAMNSLEILLSESQERVLLVGQRGREAEVEGVLSKWGLRGAAIGQVTDSGRLVVSHKGVLVADIPCPALTEKAPVYVREASVPASFAESSSWTPEGAGLPDCDVSTLSKALPLLLSHPTLASKRWLRDRAQGGRLRPLHGSLVEQGCDAAVVRVQLGSGQRLLAITNNCNARFCRLNPRRGALIAMASSLRRLACSGAVPLAMTNNLNFGDPQSPEVFYQLKESVRGLAEACRFFDIPVLGGDVSLGNHSGGHPIDPTPLVSVVGLIEASEQVTGQVARKAGERLVLLGSSTSEINGSQYLGLIHGLVTGDPPAVDLGAEERLNETVRILIRAGLISGAHAVVEGGLLVALCRMLFGPDRSLGANLDLGNLAGGRLDGMLFGESQGRSILAVKEVDLGRVISEAHLQGVSAAVLGEVLDEPVLHLKTKVASVSWEVSALRKGWESAIEVAMKVPGQGG